MANWKQCTSALGSGEMVVINLNNVAKMTPHPQGTLITFVGLSDQTTIVRETPAEILGLIW